jgi:hypothetical protein
MSVNSLTGVPIRPPDRPGEKKCKRCRLGFRNPMKIKGVAVCPYCRTSIGER